MSKLIYLSFHNKMFDKIIKSKRIEMLKIILKELKNFKIKTSLDVGTSLDKSNESTNFLIKNLNICSRYKSISDQKIEDNFFELIITKSITEILDSQIINSCKSDLVISSATIEHVGSRQNQLEMIKNIGLLTNKMFVFTTPNKFYPIDFHTKLPFFHFLPDKIYRKILFLLNFKFYSKEKNLNLLSKKDILELINLSGINKEFHVYIKHVKLFFIKSNFIIFGIKK